MGKFVISIIHLFSDVDPRFATCNSFNEVKRQINARRRPLRPYNFAFIDDSMLNDNGGPVLTLCPLFPAQNLPHNYS